VEALPVVFLSGDEQILIDTRKYDRQIVLPVPSRVLGMYRGGQIGCSVEGQPA
jgi:hypothetical protein